MAVIAVMWAWRCGGSARYGAYAPADRRTDAGTTPAARDCANDSSGSGPTKPPPIARSAGLYGSAEAVIVNKSPAPITLAIVDCFLIRSTRNTAERTKSAGCSSGSRRFRLATETLAADRSTTRSRVSEAAAAPAFRRTDHGRRFDRECGRRLGSRSSGVGGLASGGWAGPIGPNLRECRISGAL
jgi:hypothetical protein